MMIQKIREIIQDADMVLIGIGEEFEAEKLLNHMDEYTKLRTTSEAAGNEWLIPALNHNFALNKIKEALSHLAEIIKDKNYFLVTVTTNDVVWNCGFKEGRIVAPCGGSLKKQCSNPKCEFSPVALTEEDSMSLCNWIQSGDSEKISLGICPECGATMILNNIYSEHYNEQGYLDQWSLYTKWLQGTLNRKLCILELGVGMQCPSVIRFPFEKIGYFNQKATFIRVNANLYQLTEELKGKGISISENAVDFIASV